MSYWATYWLLCPRQPIPGREENLLLWKVVWEPRRPAADWWCWSVPRRWRNYSIHKLVRWKKSQYMSPRSGLVYTCFFASGTQNILLQYFVKYHGLKAYLVNQPWLRKKRRIRLILKTYLPGGPHLPAFFKHFSCVALAYIANIYTIASPGLLRSSCQ